MDTKSIRSLQLKMLGIVAGVIAPLTAIISLIHGLNFPDSISEGATNFNQSNYILPLCLGMFLIFSLAYSLTSSYDRFDKALTMIMFVGFFLVATNPCHSPYVIALQETFNVNRVGIFAVSPELSGWIHNVSAIIGFSALIIWVTRFRKSDKEKKEQTREKHLRNQVYLISAILMIFSVFIFIFFRVVGAFTAEFPIIFWVEAFILTPAAVSCLVKGGLFLRDKIKHS